MSAKTRGKALLGHRIDKNHIRKIDLDTQHSQDVESVQINLERLVAKLRASKKQEKKVQAYRIIAARLSKLAGLNNGKVWSWNYIACVNSGAMLPSKKFAQALDLYEEHLSPRKKEWFYFARGSCAVASVYHKSILRDVIRAHMLDMGYQQVRFSRYIEIKRKVVKAR